MRAGAAKSPAFPICLYSRTSWKPHSQRLEGTLETEQEGRTTSLWSRPLAAPSLWSRLPLSLGITAKHINSSIWGAMHPPDTLFLFASIQRRGFDPLARTDQSKAIGFRERGRRWAR
jgi:hypothetical protein